MELKSMEERSGWLKIGQVAEEEGV